MALKLLNTKPSRKPQAQVCTLSRCQAASQDACKLPGLITTRAKARSIPATAHAVEGPTRPKTRLASWRRSRRRKRRSPPCAPSSPTYFSRPRPWRFQELSAGCSRIGSNSLRGALPRRSSRSTMNLSRPPQTALSLPLASALSRSLGPFRIRAPVLASRMQRVFAQAP